jgi:Glyoxalase superfamily protein
MHTLLNWSLSMAMKSARPALRVFDNHLAKSFYLDWLAFQLSWEHRPQDVALPLWK